MDNYNEENPRRDTIIAWIQIFAYHERRPELNKLSIRELYDEIFGNDDRYNIDSFNNECS